MSTNKQQMIGKRHLPAIVEGYATGYVILLERFVGRGRVVRSYELLPGRLPVTSGYLGGEDFLCLGNLTSYHTGKWTCDIVFRDADPECDNFGCTFDNWWSGN
jgi:hypothetical protein